MMESPNSGNTMPQSHQELFGYYMNQVLERRESDAGEIFFTSVDDPRRENSENQNIMNEQINNTISKGVKDSHVSPGNNNQKDPLLPFDQKNSSVLGDYILYRYRFFNLAIYCFASMLNQVCWISLQPAAPAVSNAYDVGPTTVNTLSLVYMGVYLLANFPSNYIIDSYGCRIGVTVGTILTFAGMWIKVFINDSFALCVVGQMVAAFGQPFLTNTPAKISAQWFSEKGRIIATTVATAAIPLGAALGFVIPSIFVDPTDNLAINKERARDDIYWSLMTQAIMGTVGAILIVFFFRERPPTPPSASQGVEKDPFVPSMKALFSNKQALLLMVIFGFIQGVFNTLGTVIGDIASVFGYSTDDASIYGAVFIVGGIIGSACFGVWVEIKKTYKLSVIVITIMSTVSTVGTAIAFNTGESWLVAIFCFVVGFSMIPIMAVGFELGVEVTYPIDESYSTGILMLAGQLLGVLYTVTSSILIENLDKEGCIIAFIIYTVSLVIAFLLTFLIKEDLKRQKHEQQKKHKQLMQKTQEIRQVSFRNQSGLTSENQDNTF